MVCARCSRDIEDGSLSCRFCGTSSATSARAPRRLVRLPEAGSIGGVCAGLAAYLETDVTLVRLAWVILSIVPGGIIGGAIAYLAAWLLLPAASASAYPLPMPRLMRSGSDRRIAGVCGGLAEYFGVDATLVRLVVAILAIYPGAVVLGVIGYVIAWLIIPASPSSPLQPAATTA